jgi:hypothetical protein
MLKLFFGKDQRQKYKNTHNTRPVFFFTLFLKKNEKIYTFAAAIKNEGLSELRMEKRHSSFVICHLSLVICHFVLTHGVTAAQEILVLSAQVRILVGQQKLIYRASPKGCPFLVFWDQEENPGGRYLSIKFRFQISDFRFHNPCPNFYLHF